MNLDNLIDLLDAGARSPEGLNLTSEQADEILVLLTNTITSMEANERWIELQNKRIAKAVRAYRRANPEGGEITPDLVTVIDWLLDHSYRANEARLRGAVEKAVSMLMALGNIDWEGRYELQGSFLITIRTGLINALRSYQEQINESEKESTGEVKT